MTQFTYDFCLLYKIIDSIILGTVDMQTDDTLCETIEAFAKQKDEAIKSAKIMIKNRERLILDNSLKFNETRIERLDSNQNDLNDSNENDSNEVIYFRQETHIQGIQLINSIESSSITSAREKVRINLNLRKQYIAQRARDVYLATICQFETTFDLFYAAQSTESIFSSDDITTLNKRLK
jgi:folylpolyglutamate synthase/dihydropteroate synthase